MIFESFLQFITFLGLVLFSFITWKRTDWGIYLVIFLLPSYFVRFNILSIPSTFLEISIYVLFTIVLIKTSVGGKNRIEAIKTELQEISKSNKLFLSGVILLFIGAILSTAFSSNLNVSAGILKAWFFDPFLFFIVLAISLKNNSMIKNCFYSLLASGVVVSLLSIMYLLSFSYGVTYDNRLRAFYLSANHLAMYLAPMLLIALYFVLINARVREKIGFVIFFFLVTIPLYFTFSYSAFLGVIVAIVVMGSATFKLWTVRRNDILYGVLILGVLITGIALQSYTQKFHGVLNFSYPSIVSRTIIWQVAGEILKDHWLLGIGPGMFQDYYLAMQPKFPPYPEWAVPQPHDIFLAFWLQTGLLGFIGFVILLVWFFKEAFQSIKKNKDSVAILCISVIVYILIHGLFDTPYWKNDLSVIFWMFLAIIFVIQENNKKTMG